ncbi:cysteine-rich small domain-containing protein [Herbinix luporum]|uniref:Cysteine-rich small domain-containing protein n=1 Tax=Herbinix luporum TaxID=1679721 RepID=A0A0K8J601_9FIRM|nr:cysteine-rich small domain-containing protein [Herbinix luporum]MDI9489484.1 cysteine-rich small domain-containing protein [Bacillota bacterium]CUH92892.1 hypothetical protein SD1D_1346 [Herbinix luporum]
MENSYRYFKNQACKYFPCHEKKSLEDFNCLFCFCPLYFIEDCGGDCNYINGIRDCSNCLIPHEPKGYDFITKKIIAENNRRAVK